MKSLLTLLLLSVITACVSQPEQVQTEILLAQPPIGWKQSYSLINQETRLTDFIPELDSKESWTQKLSFESHKALKDIDPISIVMGDLEGSSDSCENVESFNLFSGLENNYPTTVRLTFCTENLFSKHGEVTFTKVIQGSEYLYIVKLVRKEPPFTGADTTFSKALIASWSDYFGNITACNRSNDQHPCPET